MGTGASSQLQSCIQDSSDADLKAAVETLGDAEKARLLEALGVAAKKSGRAKGNGGLETVVLRHASGASAEIYLWGATLCSYKTPDGKEQIFVSPGAIWDGKKAIRGGVPVVFPQFGQPDKAMAQHGFARTSVWSVKDLKDDASKSMVVLTLSDSEATRALWPHAFSLEYEVSLSPESLNLALRITNPGDEPISFQALLHTYFQVPDVGDVAVCNLSNHSFVDKVNGGETKKEEDDSEVLLSSFTDRIYNVMSEGPKEVTITKKGGGAAMFSVRNELINNDQTRQCDVVVWNPYEEASPGDLPPPAFKNFVCVEPGFVRDVEKLAEKQTAVVCQTITPK